jgi:hypothetical protein
MRLVRLVLALALCCWMTLGQAAGLPGLLGGASKTQPEATQPLGQSLDQVIQSLENEQQRGKLLDDLKKLRDSTNKAQPPQEQGACWA